MYPVARTPDADTQHITGPAQSHREVSDKYSGLGRLSVTPSGMDGRRPGIIRSKTSGIAVHDVGNPDLRGDQLMALPCFPWRRQTGQSTPKFHRPCGGVWRGLATSMPEVRASTPITDISITRQGNMSFLARLTAC